MVPRYWRRPLLAALLMAAFLLSCLNLLHHKTNNQLDSWETPACDSNFTAQLLPPMSRDDVTMFGDLFHYISRPGASVCGKVASFGGKLVVTIDGRAVLDGNKFACLDVELGLAEARSCLVYSAGIHDDWSFEWDMEAFGCDVVALDPSLHMVSGGQNGSIDFLRYGLAARSHQAVQNGWRLLTLEDLVQKMTHARRQVHYLKMDVESTEWSILRREVELGLESVLARHVQQLGLELHVFNHLPVAEHVAFYREVYHILLGLQEMGFRLMSYEPNPTEKRDIAVPGLDEPIAKAWESVWVKRGCVGAVS